MKITDFLVSAKFVKSKKEAKRIIADGVVRIDNIVIDSPMAEVAPNSTVQMGKRRQASLSESGDIAVQANKTTAGGGSIEPITNQRYKICIACGGSGYHLRSLKPLKYERCKYCGGSDDIHTH